MSITFNRREFIQTLMAGVALGPAILSSQRYSSAGLPTRLLGNTGEHISIIGLGGWDSAYPGISDKDSIALIREAADSGITFFDNAWEYNRGRSEEMVGRALSEGGRREKVFMMTKVCARDYNGARQHLHESLQRLRTDHVDLVQFHSIQYPGDPQRIFDPENGGLKFLLEAKKEGKLRYIGFSGHMYPEKHLEMLNMPFDWDTVQMPLNVMDAHYNSFQKQVLPVLLKKNIGVLGMKSLAAQNARIPRELNVSVELCRRYALSLPVSTVICGIQNIDELHTTLNVARDFKPLTEGQINELLDKAKEPAKDGHIEQYKNPKAYFGCSWQSKILESEKN